MSSALAVTIRFGSADLAKVRFATSPLFELWQSVRALQEPAAQTFHMPWLTETRKRLGNLDISLLYALQPAQGSNPDFIHPPPIGPMVELDDELQGLLATPGDRVTKEVLQTYPSGPVPAVLRRLIADPRNGLAALADVVRAYWRAALAPDWGRIRAVLDGDILYRARRGADGGAQALFADLNERVHYADAQISIDCECLPSDWDGCTALDGRGLLLVPSVFITSVALVYEAPWQPTLVYPARGTAVMWEPAAPAADALGALIGGRRANVLASLDVPRSTTELARQLGASAGAVSQHLSVLRSNGLVDRHRVGRVVLYSRSPAGELLANGRSNRDQPARTPSPR